MCWQGSYPKSPAFAPLRAWGWVLRTPAPKIVRERLKEGKGRYDFLVLTEDATQTLRPLGREHVLVASEFRSDP